MVVVVREAGEARHAARLALPLTFLLLPLLPPAPVLLEKLQFAVDSLGSLPIAAEETGFSDQKIVSQLKMGLVF